MRSLMIRWGLIGSAVAVLAACGPNNLPATISGFAATGAAMAGASVTAKCVSGPALTGTTAADGTFLLTLNNQTAPCIVRVEGGGVTLHSFADRPGRLNVTPLTELTIGKASGADPAAAFASFDVAKSSSISGNLQTAKAAIETQVEALTGMSIAGDMFTSTFGVNDPDDRVLDALKVELAVANKPLSALVTAVSQGKPVAPRVKVFGDSLSDSGTFGLKFTVQGTAPTGVGSADIWVDLVAKPLQAARLCPYFVSTETSFSVREECTNFAIGGGRINSVTLAGATDPRAIPLQLRTAAQVYGNYVPSDVLLVDGGGNDAADLAGAWLAATSDPAKIPALQALLSSAVAPSTVSSLLAGGAQGQVQVGALYMQALAGKLADAIEEHALGKGATKVLVMNMPDIALTPRFTAVLAGVALQTSSQQAEQVKGAIQTWVDVFNGALATRFAGSSKVAVLDYNTVFRAQVAAPASSGFDNGALAACPVTGSDSSGLPAYSFPTCTASALSAMANKPSTDWWKTYMFSDGFHPTPLAHKKAADVAMSLLVQLGWN